MSRRRSLMFYLGSTAASALAGIGVIPVLVRAFGSAEWAGFVTGQAVGAIAATVVLFGWGVGGPAAVARRAGDERVQYYYDSVGARVVLCAPVTIVLILIACIVSPDHALLVSLAAVATAATSLGAAWFFVGSRRPDLLLWVDTTPRVLATGVGLLLAVGAHRVELLPLLQLAAALISAVLGVKAVASRGRGRRPDAARVRNALAGQVDGVITALTASCYTSLPVVVVAAMSPVSLPVFALADRLTRYASTALTPAAQVLQGWVPAASADELGQRVRRGAAASVALGVAAAAALALLAGPISGLLSGEAIQVPLWYAVWSGVVLGSLITTRGLGLACLTALGRTRSVALSTICGAVVGVALLFALTPSAGGAGAVAAVGVSELVVLGYQLVALQRALARLQSLPGRVHPSSAARIARTRRREA